MSSKEETKIGKWLSAALDDPDVCDEMKTDINNWFEYIKEKNEDIKFLRCLEVAGVDNWDGHDYAVDLFHE